MNSFVDVIKYLLTLPGVEGQYVLSECFSKILLKIILGKYEQGARGGGRCDNPTVKTSFESTQSLRMQGSLALQPVCGNCSRKRCFFPGPETIETEPLQKKPSKPDFINK